MIFLGDFMQIAPITKEYSDLAAISASFKLSNLWQNVEVLRLTTNYRQHHDPEYAHDITQIGLGRSKIESGFSFTTPPHSNAAHVVKIPTSVTLSDDDLIAHAYPTAASAGHSVTCTYLFVEIILISCNYRCNYHRKHIISSHIMHVKCACQCFQYKSSSSITG